MEPNTFFEIDNNTNIWDTMLWFTPFEKQENFQQNSFQVHKKNMSTETGLGSKWTPVGMFRVKNKVFLVHICGVFILGKIYDRVGQFLFLFHFLDPDQVTSPPPAINNVRR